LAARIKTKNHRSNRLRQIKTAGARRACGTISDEDNGNVYDPSLPGGALNTQFTRNKMDFIFSCLLSEENLI
jgi:hypothetical protein